MTRISLFSAVLVAFVAGCGSGRVNPSFDVTSAFASAELDKMHSALRLLDRPLVIVGGYLDPGFGPAGVARNLRKITPDSAQILTVSLIWCGDFDACREKIINAVDKAFPTNDPAVTREVDVIGISMGGLAARYAALESAELTSAAVPASAVTSVSPATQPAQPIVRRLKIARLFTLATPHRGAVAAGFPTILSAQSDMRKGSKFLTELDEAHQREAYPIIPYARLADPVVGESQTAPPGETPIWVEKGLFEASHFGISMDSRIAADIARRLRGETPLAKEPRTPLPD